MFRKLIALALLTLAVAAAPLRAEILEQVLVKVNGDILTKTEFEQRQVGELRSRPELSNVSPGSPELQKAIAETTPDLILAAIDELLLVQRGRELGYAVGDEEFDSILANIKKENRIDTDEQFQQALKESGMTLADLRQNVERSMFVQRVQQVDVMEKISVTDDESRAYYAANASQFTTPSELTLREIVIDVPQTDGNVNVAVDDAARAKAEDVRKRLLAGEPFARLAGEASSSPSKANGGLIGPLKYDELAPAFQSVINSLTIGGLSDVLRVQRGYQILKLESRTETKTRTFDEAREDISRAVAQQKVRGEMVKYLDRLRGQATIVWRNDELKKAYELALEKRPKA